MRVRSAWLARVASLALSALVAAACATRPPAPSQAETATSAPPYAPEVQDISIMHGEIRRWRMDLNLSAEPADESVLQFRRLPLSRALVCTADERPQHDTCGEVCVLAERICENADDICRIADDLAGNSWASDKCNRAKASCNEAEQRCCGCDANATSGHGGGGHPATDKSEAATRFWD